MEKPKRTSQGLRDILFDELDELRGGEGDPTKAMAVANLAKQIINIAKVEMDFHRTVLAHQEQGSQLKLGTMELGSNAPHAEAHVTGH